MTAFFEIFLTFAAVLVFSVALAAKTKLNIGICPLFVLCGTMVWFSLFGCFDKLVLGGSAYFVLAAAVVVYLVVRKDKVRQVEFVTPAFVFFVAASLIILVYFAVRQPIPMEWDEFSFWSVAPKVVKTSGHMYTADPGNLRVTSYVPGLVMLDYAFQFFGAAFVPWKVFAAYDIFMFAIFAAVFASAKKRHWGIAAPAAVFCLLLPFLGTVYTRIIYVSTVYLSSYADIPMGLLFGGALAIYFTAEKKTPALLCGAALAVTAVSITKDTGFALALIAAALICFDLLFLEKGEETVFFKLKKIPARLCWCVILAGGPIAAFFGWAAHMSYYTGADRMNVGGSANMGTVQLVATGVKELVGIDRTEHFADVMGRMLRAFYTDSLSMFQLNLGDGVLGKIANGSGLSVVLVIFAVLAVAFLAGGRRQKIRTAWFTLWSTLGFAAYYVFIGFTYVYVFHDWQSAGLVSYNRYIYPYYLGWLALAAALLVRSLCEAERRAVWGRAFLLALCLVSVWRFGSFVRPQLSVIDYPDSYFSGMKQTLLNVDEAKTSLTEEDRVFFVSQGDDGMSWFVHYYEFYPILTDYSLGGGTLSDAAVISEAAVQDFKNDPAVQAFAGKQLTAQNLCDYLAATGCTHLYLERVDDIFLSTYGDLFADKLADYYAGKTRLYQIVQQADGMQFVPVAESGAAK